MTTSRSANNYHASCEGYVQLEQTGADVMQVGDLTGGTSTSVGASIFAFGQTGPRTKQGGFDLSMHDSGNTDFN